MLKLITKSDRLRVSRPGRFCRYCRKGTAAVEMAVMLPVVVILVFGAIEIANGIFLKNSLSIAAYEGAKLVTRGNADETVARVRIAEVLQNRGVRNATVTFSPSVGIGTPRGTRITVTVSVRAESNSFNPTRFLTNRTLSETATMVRL